jgi:hypothetical protein
MPTFITAGLDNNGQTKYYNIHMTAPYRKLMDWISQKASWDIATLILSKLKIGLPT